MSGGRWMDRENRIAHGPAAGRDSRVGVGVKWPEMAQNGSFSECPAFPCIREEWLSRSGQAGA